MTTVPKADKKILEQIGDAWDGEEQEAVLDYWAIDRVIGLSTFEGIHDRHVTHSDDALYHLDKIRTEHREQAINSVIERLKVIEAPDSKIDFYVDPVSTLIAPVGNTEKASFAEEILDRDSR